MDKKYSEKEKQLKVRLQQLESRMECLEQDVRRIKKKEENEDMQLYLSKRQLSQMQESCLPMDKMILQLIEQKQELMYQIENKKEEFWDELESEVKKNKQKIEEEIEETHMQLVSVRTNEKEQDRRKPDKTTNIEEKE